MARFKLTRAAKRDLLEIGRFTQERWGVDQRRRYLTQLDARLRALAKAPTSGRRCDEIRAGYWRFHEGRHVIFYRCPEKTVEFIRILHQAILPKRHL